MALKGFDAPDLARRGVQTDLKYAGEINAGAFLMLGSVTLTLQLASQAVDYVVETDIKFADLTLGQLLGGVEVRQTKSTDPARVRQVRPGDLVRTDQLASGSDTGAILGTSLPGVALGVNPANGKLRLKQAADVEVARIAPEGNLFNTDASIWAQISDRM